MTTRKSSWITVDRGGRRRIKDRRFRVSLFNGADRRTGLRRRSGWDRRYRQMDSLMGENRRHPNG